LKGLNTMNRNAVTHPFSPELLEVLDQVPTTLPEAQAEIAEANEKIIAWCDTHDCKGAITVVGYQSGLEQKLYPVCAGTFRDNNRAVDALIKVIKYLEPSIQIVRRL
jgi:hypothetical protein